MPQNRREFVKSLATVGLSSAALCTAGEPAQKSTKLVGDKLRVGVIGFGGRGKNLIQAIDSSSSASLVALAEVDSRILAETRKGDQSLFRTNDFRRILDRKDVDAIVSATPNHWHALITVLACKAGKHVYIEKPISHNMFESQAVVTAANRYGKLIQCGFQNRSDTGLTGFFERLHAGEFGKVVSVHGTCHRPRQSIGKLIQPLKVPEQIDYDLWLGPAMDQPIYRPRLHYDWHWDFNTGNGDVGNQGPHEWDMINWALGDSKDLPSTIQVAGNRFGWNDAGNTPNVMTCSGRLGGIPFHFEVMDLNPGAKPPYGRGVGVIVETEQGRFVGGRGGGTFVSKDGSDENFSRNKSQAKQDGTQRHMQNFFDAVLANDRKKLNSDCRIGAKSSSMAHMANISYQLGNTSSKLEIRKAFENSAQQQDMIHRMMDSTVIYNNKTQGQEIERWILGPELTFDNKQQKFTGTRSSDASDKMNREYRAGFEFPAV